MDQFNRVIREEDSEYKESEMSVFQNELDEDSVSEESLDQTVSHGSGSQKTNPVASPTIQQPLFKLKSGSNYFSMKVQKALDPPSELDEGLDQGTETDK